MAYICLNCGSTSIREAVTHYFYYDLTENGWEEVDDDYGDDDEMKCNECMNRNLIEFNEKELTKEEIENLINLDGKARLLYFFLLVRKNKELIPDFKFFEKWKLDTKSLDEKIEELKKELSKEELNEIISMVI